MHKTIRNSTRKPCYLRLNSGEYVCIPAHGAREVDAAGLVRNRAFDKHRRSGVLAEVAEAPAVRPRGPASRKQSTASNQSKGAAAALEGKEMSRTPTLEAPDEVAGDSGSASEAPTDEPQSEESMDEPQSDAKPPPASARSTPKKKKGK